MGMGLTAVVLTAVALLAKNLPYPLAWGKVKNRSVDGHRPNCGKAVIETMEENEKKSEMPLWVMILLIAVLMGAVLMIFQMIDRVMPKPEQPGIEVSFTAAGGKTESGRLVLTTMEQLPDGIVQTWADSCEADGKYRWMVEKNQDGWTLYLWLPQMEAALEEKNLELSSTAVGEQWTLALSLPEGEMGQTGPDSPVIQIVCTDGTPPSRVQMYQNGQLLPCAGTAVASDGQLYFAS